MAPDRYSRSQEDEGRRIRAIPGGWGLINYKVYREKLSAEENREKARIRKQRQREREKAEADKKVTPCHAAGDNSREVTTSRSRSRSKYSYFFRENPEGEGKEPIDRQVGYHRDWEV